MKTSSHHKVDRTVSIVNKPVFKLPTTLPRRVSVLQQSLTSPSATTTTTSSSLVSPHVLSIANTMKLRMKAAVNTMVWNGNRHNTLLTSIVSPSAATGTVTTTPSSLCDLQQQKQQPGQHQKNVSSSPMLKNGALLKQYVTFVQEETGVIMDMDLANSSPTATASDDSYQLSIETQQNHLPQSLASSGAALIESITHRSTSKLDSEKLSGSLPSTASSTKPVTPQRRTSRPIKSTSVAVALKMEEEERRFKKSERLRLKHQRKSRWTSLKTTMISNKSKKEHATSAGSAAAVIRCICATPNEEFGSMVQCDDCACWLHLECLALNEDALDETFRCPSCSISLGPGQHLTSAITWRFAAQLKSQRLANRCNTAPEAATTTSSNKWNNKRKNVSYRRGSDRKHSQGNKNPLHRHHRSQQRIEHHQKEKRRRLHHSRRPMLYSAQGDTSSFCSSSSDSDDNTDEQQHLRTWMIPKMTIHSSISTTMTTSTGNVLVQKLNNHRKPTTSARGNSTNADDHDTDADEEMAVDSDTTESDWECSDRYQFYHRRQRSSIHGDDDEDDDDDNSQDTAASTSTRGSLSSINTTPSLTLSPSHAGSDTDSPCEASTPPDEHFGHDDSYMQVMTDNNNNTTTDAEQGMLSTTATSACLDQESLLWLSRLAYLESLQSSTRQQCFTPHASDVFLWGDQQQQQKFNPVGTMMIGEQEEEDTNDSQDHHHYSQLTRVPLLATTTTRSDPPSAICSHDLSQFSFDAGPFWSPIQ
ncbi:hypothetical protein BCR42DRAFT_414788 [Absidia repens]|uniref:PHD-type domain-containing protein n=1 Tax=Absidia repens TaxID=90262 RepID=A0A1X2IGN4_9FUNG|nr:hypothetical protein BCR42DRAFT_414788 [Absidia repens]